MNELSDHEIRMMKIACLAVGFIWGIYLAKNFLSKKEIHVLVIPSKTDEKTEIKDESIQS